ncbi:exonuclease domain-containing protein [uncultured Vibrio sp.]|uniref:3'-5' exonuclease n=1 Tax=uncultured Vibrio sp. TaxID=114054 RepID=UPI0026231EEC|nr:exonuclease domain-containing protein [uncultured Vibrio sp.]
MFNKCFSKWLISWLRHSESLSQESVRRNIRSNPIWSIQLTQYLETPQPEPMHSMNDIEFISLDFETTGLDFNKDKILSIGIVNVSLDGIDLSSSEEVFIKHGKFIKAETAQINEITPKQLLQGVDLDTAMDWLLERIRGKVVVAHSACIEKQFIESYLHNTYKLSKFPCYFIDTLKIEKQFSYEGKCNHHTSYQLDDLRRHHNLPVYYSHSAASDAVACAELFLLQFKKFKLFNTSTIGELCWQPN